MTSARRTPSDENDAFFVPSIYSKVDYWYVSYYATSNVANIDIIFSRRSDYTLHIRLLSY